MNSKKLDKQDKRVILYSLMIVLCVVIIIFDFSTLTILIQIGCTYLLMNETSFIKSENNEQHLQNTVFILLLLYDVFLFIGSGGGMSEQLKKKAYLTL